MDAATLNQKLETFLRVATFPVGVKSLKPGEPLPAKVKRPKQDLGVEVAICQAVAMARRYGWTLAFGREDVGCPIALAAFGFERRNEAYTSGTLAAGMYASCLEAGARMEAALSKYAEGEFAAIVAGPLGRIAYEPDTVIVYGLPAQVLRLVNAALWEKGGSLASATTGRGDCTDLIIKGRQTKEPQLVLPCAGDRIFGMAADDEMAFTFPFAMAEKIVEGLEKTHAGGLRFPTPQFLRYEVEYAKPYVELRKAWDAERKEKA
jgi:uncharacterized protein (DUF169 family)